MAEKKFYTVDGVDERAEVAEDFESAPKFDKVKIGKLGAYFRDGFKLKFIPYEYMERAFIRINEANGRMCCATASFQYYRLVFVHAGEEFAEVLSEDEKAMDDALAKIHENAPEIIIGI